MSLTINQCRKILGKEYEGMTDHQIQKLISYIYSFADLTADILMDNGSNKQLGVIDVNSSKEENGS